MSLGHTFSSAVHYTYPFTSSGTPIKAIQAKSCASPWLFFFPGADEICYKASQPHFQFIFQHQLKFVFSHLNNRIKTYQLIEQQMTHSVFIHKANFGANTRLSLTQDSLLGSPRGPWPERLPCVGMFARIAKMHHGFLCDTHPNYELQIIWEHRTPAAAMLILCPARQAKSVWWWLAGEASNSCTFSVSHKIPWIQAWQIPAEVRRWYFDFRDQDVIGFSARANLQATNPGFRHVRYQEIRYMLLSLG